MWHILSKTCRLPMLFLTFIFRSDFRIWSVRHIQPGRWNGFGKYFCPRCFLRYAAPHKLIGPTRRNHHRYRSVRWSEQPDEKAKNERDVSKPLIIREIKIKRRWTCIIVSCNNNNINNNSNNGWSSINYWHWTNCKSQTELNLSQMYTYKWSNIVVVV